MEKREKKISVKKNSVKFRSAKSIEKEEIKWTPQMSVNDPKIDGQHIKILNEIELLKENINSDDPLSKTREVIHFLSVYIKEHLDYEEIYMKAHNYPYFESHKRQHDYFREEYRKFNEGLSAVLMNKLIVNNILRDYLKKLLDFLVEWWINHIAISDHMYADYIKKHEKMKT